MAISGVAAALVVSFLKLRSPRVSFKEKMARMYWMYGSKQLTYPKTKPISMSCCSGNALIIASSTAVVIALT